MSASHPSPLARVPAPTSERKRRRLAALAALTAVFALPLSASGQQSDAEWLARCEDRTGGTGVARCEVRVQELPATGSLTVRPGGNGGVAVRGWDGDAVEVHARIQTRAPTEREARSLAEEVATSSSGGTLRADGPRTGDRRHWSVSYMVRVPHSYDLDLVTHNGPVAVRQVTGALRLETRNGPLTLEEVGGDVRARTRNGPLDLRLVGSGWEGRGLDAETANGPVSVRIAEGYSAVLETGTVNGPWDVEFPLTVTMGGHGRGRTIRANLGEGGAVLRAVTRNGPVTIGRL